MNVRDFEYIVEISQQGSLSKAAQRLFVSQSALSKFLSKMENELKIKLFQRMGNHLILTKAGEIYVDKAKQILGLNEQLISQINDLSGHTKNVIRLGIPKSRGEFIIDYVIPEFRLTYPTIKITVLPTGTTTLLDNLSQGDLDIVLANNNSERLGLSYELIGYEEIVLAVPADHKLNNLSRPSTHHRYPLIDTHMWIQEPIIIASNNMLTGQYARYFFTKNNLAPTVINEIHNIDLIMLAVKNHLGIALVPSIPLSNKHDSRKINFLSIDDTEQKMKVSIITKEDKLLSKPEKALIEIMRNQYVKSIT